MSRGLAFAAIAVILLLVACVWFGRKQPAVKDGVSLAFVGHGTNQSATQDTFRLYNDKPRAIFLSWMIVETNSPGGWRVAEKIEPKDPRVVDAGKFKDLSVS